MESATLKERRAPVRDRDQRRALAGGDVSGEHGLRWPTLLEDACARVLALIDVSYAWVPNAHPIGVFLQVVIQLDQIQSGRRGYVFE